MNAVIALTQESQRAIQQRKDREETNRFKAMKRFESHQQLIKARKERNRAIVSSMVIIMITIGLVSMADTKPVGAKAGNVVAKSDLSKAQIKALNIMPAHSERHAMR